MNAQSIVYGTGQYNPAGTKALFYYAYVEDILSMPVLADPATATTLASLVEMATAVVMKTGKRIFDHYATSEENEVKCTLVGSRDGKGYENSFEYKFPGNDPIQLGFQASTANRQVVLWVPEKNGRVRLIGSLEDPAYMETAEYTSGKKIADSRGTIITFKASAATPAPIYTPALTSLLTVAS